MKKWLKRVLIVVAVVVGVVIAFSVGTILWAFLDFDGMRSIMGVK